MAALMFTCPRCKAIVSASELTPIVVVDDDAPNWICGKCGATVPRAQWGFSTDFTEAAKVFLYTGPATSEKPLQKVNRNIVAKDLFAGGDWDNIRDTPALKKPALTVDPKIGSFEPVFIYHTKEGYMLRGRYYIPAQPTRTQVALLLSGSGDVASVYFAKVVPRYLKHLHMPVLMVDYRGFGQSDADRNPTARGLYTDAEAMFAFLTSVKELGGKGFRGQEVAIHGYSLGTGVATELAKRKKSTAGALILQCPFTSAADAAQQDTAEDYPSVIGLAAGAIAGSITAHGSKMDVRQKIKTLTLPVLLLIANQDAKMKSHGDLIEQENRGKNVKVARYDGPHEQPENAFKDGRGHNLVITASGPAFANTVARQPMIGESVLKDKTAPGSNANSKQYKGQGCIQDIKNFYNSF